MSSTKRTVQRNCREVHIQIFGEFGRVFQNDIITHLFSASDSQILPSELATQSVRIKEEQLRREEEKVILMHFEAKYVIAHTILSPLQLREIELRVQREINEKRQELMAKETALRLVSSVFVTFSLANINAPPET